MITNDKMLALLLLWILGLDPSIVLLLWQRPTYQSIYTLRSDLHEVDVCPSCTEVQSAKLLTSMSLAY